MNTYLKVWKTFHPQLTDCKKQKDIFMLGHKDTDYAAFMAAYAYHKLKVDKERAAEDLKDTMEALDNGTLFGPTSEGMNLCSNYGLNSFAEQFDDEKQDHNMMPSELGSHIGSADPKYSHHVN